MGQKKKRGLFRSTAGGLARAGGATVKGTAKVAAKGGYITMKTGAEPFSLQQEKHTPANQMKVNGNIVDVWPN